MSKKTENQLRFFQWQPEQRLVHSSWMDGFLSLRRVWPFLFRDTLTTNITRYVTENLIFNQSVILCAYMHLWPWRTDHLTHTHSPFWTHGSKTDSACAWETRKLLQKLPCFRPHSVEQFAWQSEELGHLTRTVQAIVKNCLVWARILVGGACEKSDFNRRRINVQFDWLIDNSTVIHNSCVTKLLPITLTDLNWF